MITSAQVVGLRAVDQGLSMTMSIADVTTIALGSIKGSLDRIQADVVAAQQAGVSLSAIQSDISAQQQSIIAVTNSASFNGVNWLIGQNNVSQKVTGYKTFDLSDTDDVLIKNNRFTGIEHYSLGSTTVNTTNNQAGDSTSQTSFSGVHGVIDTTGNSPSNTSSIDPGSNPSPTSPLSIAHVVVPMSMSSTNGIVTSSFSLGPLTLFTDSSGTVTYDETDYYANKNVVQPETISTATTHSYDDDSASPAGILDRNIPLSGQAGQTILNLDVTRASTADFAVIGHAVQTAISGIMIASTAIGSLQTQISNQRTFNSALADSLTSGVGSLVDADMNVASIRLQALQTQQQLGIQALSIANQDGQLLLKLFEAA